MNLILSIETSIKNCSVAIHKDGILIADNSLCIERSHSEYLLFMIDQLFEIVEYNKEDLNAIAVSIGPGSYTGLRVGLSTAKGLCFGLNIPIIAINTLDIMINEVSDYNFSKNLLCPMIDARRSEVYCKIVEHKGEEFKEILPLQSKIIDNESFIDILKEKKILIFGDGSHKSSKIIENKNAIFINNIVPNAKSMGTIAFSKFINKKFEDLNSLEPIYLKSPAPNIPHH